MLTQHATATCSLYLVTLATLAGAALASLPGLDFTHHNNTALAAALQQVHNQCPDISRLYTLSESSVLGVPLYALEFSRVPGRHQLTVPEVKLVANMHGNEVLGRELLLHLAGHLCTAHQAGDADITALVANTRIHLIPSMNPDGWQAATAAGGRDYLLGRNNANDVDLNRDFPDLDRVVYNGARSNHHLLREARLEHRIQPETESLIKLILDTPFVLSANMHGGDLVANYPYDESKGDSPTEYAASPDDQTFRALASVYAGHHPRMSNPATPGCDSPVNEFAQQGGITNGAAWYSVPGGMQDFNYLASNDFEITLELGCDKYPPAESLTGEWADNKEAMLEFLWAAHWGVRGVVRAGRGGSGIPAATIHVRNITRLDRFRRRQEDIEHDVQTAAGGDYWRLLTPGEYEVIVQAEGFMPQAKLVQVDNSSHKPAVVLDFELEPEEEEEYEDKEEEDGLGDLLDYTELEQAAAANYQDQQMDQYPYY